MWPIILLKGQHIITRTHPCTVHITSQQSSKHYCPGGLSFPAGFSGSLQLYVSPRVPHTSREFLADPRALGAPVGLQSQWVEEHAASHCSTMTDIWFLFHDFNLLLTRTA